MSWVAASAPAKKKTVASAVTVSLSSGRYRPVIRIVIRAALLEESWVAQGKAASVEIGAGDHSGMMRLKAGGAFVFAKMNGRTVPDTTVALRIAPPPGFPVASQKPTACMHQIQNGALIISLPAWASAGPEILPAPNPSSRRPFAMSAPSPEEDRARRLGGKL